MRKLIVLASLFIFSCGSDDIEIIEPINTSSRITTPNTQPSTVVKKYTISIDSVLTRDGLKSVPKDIRGYYHIKLIPTLNQQSHRVTGTILLDGKEPNPVQKIEWESNLYWYLRKGDTIASITKTYINYLTGQYTIVKLPPLVSNVTALVPTTNPASYSGSGGKISTMISPTGNMIGDTLVLKTYHYESKITLYTKVVLE
jgi:hypothetical protein